MSNASVVVGIAVVVVALCGSSVAGEADVTSPILSSTTVENKG